MPASDTGAVEAALWNLLGSRGVDVLAWDSFGRDWLADVLRELRLTDVRALEAEFGHMPDLSLVDSARDVVLTWNGTTAGVKVPHENWIAADRAGLVIADATSAAFSMRLPWDRLDVVTWSWQKALGGEAAHGMLALSPRAIARLESWQPPWPVPKIFRLARNGKVMEGVFKGETINTPSMLAVEDALDGLAWAQSVGGLESLIARSCANLAAVETWVRQSTWVDFLASDPVTRSSTSICLKIVDPWFTSLADSQQRAVAKRIADILESEAVAYDVAAYRDAPPGLRLWGGSTVETSDLGALFPWLDWGWGEARARAMAA